MATANKRTDETAMENTPATNRACRVRSMPQFLGLSGSGRIFGLWPQAVEVIILAVISCFLGHLVRLGWQAKFGMVI